MSIRSTGTATISFGLVSAPVKLHVAAEAGEGAVSFNNLHEPCMARVKQGPYVCTECEAEVPKDEMVKGYEVRRGEYLVFSAEEIKALAEESSGRIDLVEFVPLATIKREQCEKIHYLSPDKGGDKAYSLLCAALRQTDMAGIGQYASRGKEHLVAIRAHAEADVLVMEQLLYFDELRDVSLVPFPAKRAAVTPMELKLATQLIGQLEVDAFDATKYFDHQRQRMVEAIEAKDAGKPIRAIKLEKAPDASVDVLAALQASLGATTPAAKAKPKRKAS